MVLKRNLWKMADVVEDRGTSVFVKRWNRTADIPLSEVSRMQQEPYIVGNIVTLVFQSPGMFGSEIRFYAPDQRKVPTIREDLEQLAMRVNGLR